MAIGRPIELTPNITSKNISVACTEGQTEFTVTDGYRINEIAVYRNGVRLVDGRDFSATDGQTVTLISDTVVADDIIEFSVFDSFDVAGVIVSAASSQAVNGNLHVTGELYAGDFKPTNLVASAATFNSALHVGSALTSNAAGDVETIGIITAATFKGDGSGLTGIGETVNVRTETITVSGVSTFTGVSNFSAAVNVDATTDSTSTSTGALIVDGGLGVAKNVYIGAGLSVAGTLTYEDVTNVDSVGVVTAKSGVNITGGQLQVGVAYSVGAAGVVTAKGATFNGDVEFNGNAAGVTSAYWDASADSLIFKDNSYAKFGNGSDFSIYHDGTNNILSSAAGPIKIQGPGSNAYTVHISARSDKETIKCLNNTNAPYVELYYNDSKKFETTNDGTVTTGIATVTNLHSGSMDCTGELNFTGNGEKFIDVATLNGSNSLTIRHQDGGSYETAATFTANGAAVLQFNGGSKFSTTNEGARVIGFTSTTAGMGVTGGLFEGAFIKAGKLSDNATIGIATANIFYFTTQENTTITPNITWSDTHTLSSKMNVGDVASVTVITTAAAAGYAANWAIDGNGVTEEWVGGSAPSAGGADGLDIYSFTIIKIGTGTGDSGWKVIANVTNAT